MSHTLSAAQVQRLIDVTAALGPWAMPVATALQSGLIAVTVLRRDCRAPLADMRRKPLPVLAWLGDDDGHASGPAGWRCAHQVARWARAGLIHAAGGEREHYEAAVIATVTTGRFLLIETASRFAREWAGLMAGTPCLVIVPRGGKPHPIDMGETRH